MKDIERILRRIGWQRRLLGWCVMQKPPAED